MTPTSGRFLIFFGAIFGLSFAAQATCGTPVIVTTPVTAIQANTFLSTLGANIHVSQGYSEAAYEPQFVYTGIRNARDYSNPSLVALHNNTGVLMDIIADPTNVATLTCDLAAAGGILSLEGPNEPNNFPITYQGVVGGGNTGSWLPVAKYQRDLYAVVKADLILGKYPVFGPSEVGAEVDNVGLQCNVLDSSCAGASGVTLMAAGTKYADYINQHNYVAGNGSCAVPAPNQAWLAEDPVLKDACWDSVYGNNVKVWGYHFGGYTVAQAQNVPRVTTETGWNSLTPGQDYQGKVLVNLFLDAFKRGWAYTFLYEMSDDSGCGTVCYGLYTQAGVAKLAATYIHTLTTILKDTKNFTPGQLSYAIPNEPATVHDMLLQKSDGKFELAIWDEQTTSATTDKVTVALGTAATVTEFDTTLGIMPVTTLTNVTSVPLTLSDHAMILEITK